MLEYFEIIASKSKKTEIKSSVAWFLGAFKNKDFNFPGGFQSSLEKVEAKARVEAVTKTREDQKKVIQTKIDQKADQKRELLDLYWDSLTGGEQESLEKEAVKMTDNFKRKGYKKMKTQKGVFLRLLDSK